MAIIILPWCDLGAEKGHKNAIELFYFLRASFAVFCLVLRVLRIPHHARNALGVDVHPNVCVFETAGANPRRRDLRAGR